MHGPFYFMFVNFHSQPPSVAIILGQADLTWDQEDCPPPPRCGEPQEGQQGFSPEGFTKAPKAV